MSETHRKIGLILFLGIVIGGIGWTAYAQREVNKTTNEIGRIQRLGYCAGRNRLQCLKDLQKRIESGIEVPNITTPAAGKPGEPGKDATDAQVIQAVAIFCQQHNSCKGEATKGEPGPSPTIQQLVRAMVRYCTMHDGCKGPQGSQGAQGAQGVQGAAATLTDAQILAAVTAYCDSHDNCSGGNHNESSVKPPSPPPPPSKPPKPPKPKPPDTVVIILCGPDRKHNPPWCP